MYAGAKDITSGNYFMSYELQESGTYLAIAYVVGGRSWWLGVTDTTSSNYWSLNDCTGGAKIYENMNGNTVYGFKNLSGKTCNYAGSFFFLIKLS